MSTGYTYRRGGPSLGTVVRQDNDNPLKFVPSKCVKAVGDKARIRVLDFSALNCPRVICIPTPRLGTGQGEGKMFTENIHEKIVVSVNVGTDEEPEFEYSIVQSRDLSESDLVCADGEGTLVRDITDRTTLYRIPVYVYEYTTKGEKKVVNEVRYLEVGWGIFADILNLPKHPQLQLEFMEGCPEYDIDIVRAAPSGQKTWQVVGIQYNGRKPDDNYMVSAPEVFGKEWGSILDQLQKVGDTAREDFQTDDDVKRRLAPPKGERKQSTDLASSPRDSMDSHTKPDEQEREPEPNSSSQQGNPAEEELHYGGRRNRR